MSKATFGIASDQSLQKLELQERIGSPANQGSGVDSMQRAREMFERKNSQSQNIKVQKRLRQRLRNKLRKQKETTFVDETTGWTKDEPAKIDIKLLDEEVNADDGGGLASKVAKKKFDETKEAVEAKRAEEEHRRHQHKVNMIKKTMRRLEKQNNNFLGQMHLFRRERKSESRLGSEAIRAVNSKAGVATSQDFSSTSKSRF